MKSTTIIVYPTCDQYYTNRVEIEYTIKPDGQITLSIRGKGKDTAGQNAEHILNLDANKDLRLAAGWTTDMVNTLRTIWDTYHLNDMRPYTQAMKKLGWDKLAQKEVYEITYELDTPTISAQAKLKNKIIKDAKVYGHTELSDDEQKLLGTPFSKKRYVYNLDLDELDLDQYRIKAINTVTLGHIYAPDSENYDPETNFKDGLLGKLCPDDNCRYGSSWYFEPIPKHILEWLSDLPGITHEKSA